MNKRWNKLTKSIAIILLFYTGSLLFIPLGIFFQTLLHKDIDHHVCMSIITILWALLFTMFVCNAGRIKIRAMALGLVCLVFPMWILPFKLFFELATGLKINTQLFYSISQLISLLFYANVILKWHKKIILSETNTSLATKTEFNQSSQQS